MKRLALAAVLLVAFAVQTSWAGFEEGEAAFVRGDYIAAREEYLPLAESGHPGAQFGLANVYLLGFGDIEEGLKYAAGAKECQ